MTNDNRPTTKVQIPTTASTRLPFVRLPA